MAQPIIKLGSVDQVFTRMMHFEKAGDIEQGHTHTYGHITLLAHGSVKITVEGKETIFKAPHMIYISKDKEHMLEALEDNTVAACIHSLHNREETLISDDMIPNGVEL
jgi:quercetin dioxygenase-like cupin family protein